MTAPHQPPAIRIDLPLQAIADFCRRWKITELSVFGSVLRDDFRPDSDVDMMATFSAEADWSLLDHARMEIELSQLLRRDVELLTRRAVESSENWIRRRAILESARVVYAA